MDEPDFPSPTTFLVERYWPGIDESRLRELLPRLDREARSMTAEGTPVDHLGSILMPLDQVVFSLISAETEAVVRRLNERADMPLDRIARAVSLLPGDTGARVR